MKKLILFLFAIFLLCACSKDEPDCPQNPDNSSSTENVYYVRYEVKMYVPEPRFKLNVAYTTEVGEKAFHWQVLLGKVLMVLLRKDKQFLSTHIPQELQVS